jgi:uracil-DNA glycosylase family 4
MQPYLINKTRDPICQQCPRLGAEIVQSVRGNTNETLLVIDTPSLNDARLSRVLTADVGKLVKSALEDLHWNRAEISVTHSLRCYDPHRKPEHDKTALACCTQHLVKEIELIQPQHIVTMGAISLRQVFKRDAILKNHGVLLTARIGSRDYNGVALVHPKFVLRTGLGLRSTDLHRPWLAALANPLHHLHTLGTGSPSVPQAPGASARGLRHGDQRLSPDQAAGHLLRF